VLPGRRNLIAEYCRKPAQKPKPLSIAVFGPPGSGKSFAVEEIAGSVRPGEISALTFNLSQFALPSEDQLDLHTNGREFLALVQQLDLQGEILEKLAEAAHDAFCAEKRAKGWTLGPRDNDAKKHPLLIPYADLPDTYKDSNRATVRNIPRKLAAAGYAMVPSRSNQPPLEFPGADLETLARLEHDLWMEDRLAAGFTLGPADEPGHSPYLVPWEQLTEDVKEIDRDQIRNIPGILARAGYAIERVAG
jgi:hypothetical protein